MKSTNIKERKIGIDISLLRDVEHGFKSALSVDDIYYDSIIKNERKINFNNVKHLQKAIDYSYLTEKTELVSDPEYYKMPIAAQDMLEGGLISEKKEIKVSNEEAFQTFIENHGQTIYSKFRKNDTLFGELNKYMKQHPNVKLSIIGDENPFSIGWTQFFLANNKCMITDYNFKSRDLDKRYDLVISDNVEILRKCKNTKKRVLVKNNNNLYNKIKCNVVIKETELLQFLNKQ